VRELTLVGSLDLANIVAWEDLSGGSDSWEVLSVRGDGTGGWVRPSLFLSPCSLSRSQEAHHADALLDVLLARRNLARSSARRGSSRCRRRPSR